MAAHQRPKHYFLPERREGVKWIYVSLTALLSFWLY